MSWISLTFSSIVFFTLQNLLQRKIAIKSDNPRMTALVFNILSVFFALVVYFLTGSYTRISLPQAPVAWVFLFISVVCYGLFERLRFTVARLIDASVFSIIFNISILTGFIGALVLYHETLTPGKLLGAGLIIIALGLASDYRRQKISKKGIYLAILICTLTGIGVTLDKMGAIYFTADTYQVLVWVLPLSLIIFPLFKAREIIREIKNSTWKMYVMAILNVLGYWLQLRALAISEASRIIPLVNTSTLFTILAAIIFLGERSDLKKKIIAGIITVVGVYLLI
jgi:uncharacterized membrane protein